MPADLRAEESTAPTTRAALADALKNCAEDLRYADMARCDAGMQGPGDPLVMFWERTNMYLSALDRAAAALLSAPAWDRERLARALREATRELSISLPECDLPEEAEGDRNPGGLCGPCCETLADAVLARLEVDRG